MLFVHRSFWDYSGSSLLLVAQVTIMLGMHPFPVYQSPPGWHHYVIFLFVRVNGDWDAYILSSMKSRERLRFKHVQNLRWLMMLIQFGCNICVCLPTAQPQCLIALQDTVQNEDMDLFLVFPCAFETFPPWGEWCNVVQLFLESRHVSKCYRNVETHFFLVLFVGS